MVRRRKGDLTEWKQQVLLAYFQENESLRPIAKRLNLVSFNGPPKCCLRRWDSVITSKKSKWTDILWFNRCLFWRLRSVSFRFKKRYGRFEEFWFVSWSNRCSPYHNDGMKIWFAREPEVPMKTPGPSQRKWHLLWSFHEVLSIAWKKKGNEAQYVVIEGCKHNPSQSPSA